MSDQPCSVCGNPSPNDPHHLIGVGGMSGMGLKAPDTMLMPLCHADHMALHAKPSMWPAQWEWIARTMGKAIEEGVFEWDMP